jgi:membrane protease YdiL (CAAX protease family)
VIAWLGILGVVGVVAVRVWIMSHDVRMEEAGDDVTLQIAARNTVGYHILTQTAGRQAVPVSKLRELTASVVNQAHTPKQRLGAVTVIGEVLGAPAALDELDRLKGTLGSPGLRAASHTLRTIYESGPTVVTGDQALGLVKQLGWQGKLALSFQLPAEEARRAKILSTSLRAFAATLGLELVIGLALLTGVALLTLGIVKGVDGKLTLAYRPNPGPAGPFLEAFAIYLVSYVGVGYFAAKVHLKPEWLVYLIELAFVAFAACWPLFRGTSILQLREGLGWHSGRGVVREALAGLGAYIAGLPLMVAAIAVTVLLSKVAGEKPIHPIVFGAGGAGWGAIIGLYLLASVWAPVVEETMFRGALFNHLRAGHRWLFSGVISSLIFAALHPQGWTAIPVLATIGFIFAATREWRGTVIASGVAHALNNAVATTMLVLVLA